MFDINSTLAKKQDFTFLTSVLRLGGKRENSRKMHIHANKEVLRLKISLDQKEAEIKEYNKSKYINKRID